MTGGGSAPAPPKLKKVDVPQAQATTLKYDTEAWKRTDEDFAKRFSPLGLTSARDYAISDAGRQLTGEIPAQATEALGVAGLAPEARGIVGGNEFETARNLNKPILAKEQRDRNYFENILSGAAVGDTNPRSAGLNSKDVLDIVSANSGNANAFQQAIYGSQLNNYASSVQQGAQNFGAITNLVSGLATDFSKYWANNNTGSPYTNPWSPVWSPGGWYGGGFTTPGAPGYNADIGPIQPLPGG